MRQRGLSSFMYFSQTEREVRFLMCLEFARPEEARWVIDSGRRWFMGVSLKRGGGGGGRRRVGESGAAHFAALATLISGRFPSPLP